MPALVSHHQQGGRMSRTIASRGAHRQAQDDGIRADSAGEPVVRRSTGWTILAVLMLAGCAPAALAEAQADLESMTEEVTRVTAEVTSLESEIAALQTDLDGRTDQQQALESERDELLDVYGDAPTRRELEERIAALEQEAQDVADLAAWEAALQRREDELNKRERQPASTSRSESSGSSQSGCSSGQVNLNTASSTELQRIHQVGPARAEQILDLRPFSSVDALTRVSGIGNSHLSAIKGQGLACVP